MTIHLPDFRQEFLDSVSVGIWLVIDDATAVGEVPWGFYSEYGILHDSPATMLAFLSEGELSDDEETPQGTHFLHIELSRGDADWLEDGEIEKVDIDQLKNRVSSLLKGRTITASIRGGYCIERSVLPRGGMIETLLGVSTSTCGMAMELRGSRFAIFGDTFTEIDWTYDEELDSIAGSIEGNVETEVSEEIFTAIADILQDGVECFVFESTQPEIKHAQRIRKRPARG